jgi:L-asparaginase / beta-aspartyl-peptidase
MRTFYTSLIAFFFLACQSPTSHEANGAERTPQNGKQDWAIAIHGGAGGMNRENLPEAKRLAYEASLKSAIDQGIKMLEQGADASSVVEAVIRNMEDDSLFNAGRGAVLTANGEVELDASIMRGSDLQCGAVSGIQNIKNPIMAAKLVMDSSKHVFLSGKGATAYALEHGLEWVDNSYFITKTRWELYQERLQTKGVKEVGDNPISKKGTVGCVVLDRQGHLAAGTSTGGMMMKEYGRIGDSPVIGAGTYADDRTCAVSGTGHGEYFIRRAVAHEISARMMYAREDLHEACEAVVLHELKDMGGDGGVIAVDTMGNISMVFNTEGMFRACADANGKREVGVFR